MPLGTPTRVAAESAAAERLFVDQLSFAGDSAYPTGGSTNFDQFVRDLTNDGRNVIAVIGNDCGANDVHYVPPVGSTPGKLKVYVRATGVEVANATDLSAVTFQVVVFSK